MIVELKKYIVRDIDYKVYNDNLKTISVEENEEITEEASTEISLQYLLEKNYDSVLVEGDVTFESNIKEVSIRSLSLSIDFVVAINEIDETLRDGESDDEIIEKLNSNYVSIFGTVITSVLKQITSIGDMPNITSGYPKIELKVLGKD